MASTTCNNIGDVFCDGAQPVLAYLGACLVFVSSLHDVVHPLVILTLAWRRPAPRNRLAAPDGVNTIGWWAFRLLEFASLAAGWLLLGWALARALFDSGKSTVIVIADPIDESVANVNGALAAGLVFLTSALTMMFIYWRQLRRGSPPDYLANTLVSQLVWLLAWLLIWLVPLAFVGGWAWIAWALQVARSPARRFLAIAACMTSAFAFLATIAARVDTPYPVTTFASCWSALTRTVLARYLYALGLFWVATSLSMHQLSAAEDVSDTQWAIMLTVTGALTLLAFVMALGLRAYYRLAPFHHLHPLERMRVNAPLAPRATDTGADTDMDTDTDTDMQMQMQETRARATATRRTGAPSGVLRSSIRAGGTSPPITG